MQKDVRKALKGEATPEQIEKWKKENPQGIYMIVVEGKPYYFRMPTRAILSYATSRATADSYLDYFDALAEESYLEGQANAIPGKTDSDFDDYRAIVNGLKEATEAKEHELVKL